MLLASLLVMDILARLHPYRLDPNGEFAVQTLSLTAGMWRRLEVGEPDADLARYLGRGAMTPMLDQPFLDMLRERDDAVGSRTPGGGARPTGCGLARPLCHCARRGRSGSCWPARGL